MKQGYLAAAYKAIGLGKDERNEINEQRPCATLADAPTEYHRLWLRCCHLDDQLQAAKADCNEERAARVRAELSALIDGPYTAARLRYDAALQLAPSVKRERNRGGEWPQAALEAALAPQTD